jgi:hypothetical protein
MTHERTFTRKVIYLVIIAALLLPLYLLGRPATPRKTEQGEVTMTGGKLARIRIDHQLSEAQIGQIDPASSTLKLATFGLRGVAVAVLWHHAQEYQKKLDWNNTIATSKQIIALEPHFLTVWDFLGWNLAYNASSEFDDYRERYRWVIRGFDFLVDGTEYNQQSPELYRKAGWVISQKIGIADEKEQYRRLLREDDDFHERYHTPSMEQRDNWLIGRKWYFKAEELYRQGADIGGDAPTVFYSRPRMNLINYAEWQEKDGIFGDKAKQNWENAQEEWTEFGGFDIQTTIEHPDPDIQFYHTTLREYEETRAEAARLEERLDELAPGVKIELYWEKWNRLTDAEKGSLALYFDNSDAERSLIIQEKLAEEDPDWRKTLMEKRDAIFTEEEHEAMKVPEMLRDDQENALVQNAMNSLAEIESRALAQLRVQPMEIARRVQNEDRSEAMKLVEQIGHLERRATLSNVQRNMVNYQYHLRRTEIEQTDEAVNAHRLRFEAREAYYEGDLKAASETYLAAMEKWYDLMHKEGFEDLQENPIFRGDLLDMIEKYVIILDRNDELFPEDFRLADFLREELQRRDIEPKGDLAMQYAREAMEEEDFEKADMAIEAAIDVWSTMLSNQDYMKLVPIPAVNEKVLDTIALYQEHLDETNQTLPENYPLKAYVDLQLAHSEALTEVDIALANGMQYLQRSEYPQAQEELETALEKLQPLVERYPTAVRDPDSPLYLPLENTVETYQNVLDLRGKPIPDDFPFPQFLKDEASS